MTWTTPRDWRTWPGFGSMKRPADLFAKLEHDLARIQVDQTDQFAAADFFQDAEAMLDWVETGRKRKEAREALRDSEPLLQVASNVACGIKHFQVEAAHHEHVRHADIEGGDYEKTLRAAEQEEVRQRFPPGVLYLSLDGAAAAALGRYVAGLEIAEKVVGFWRKYLEAHGPRRTDCVDQSHPSRE